MKVLVFTTLFPNSEMPNYAVFIKERIAHLAKCCDIRVVAPVPYFPKLKVNKRWDRFSRVPLEETIEGVTVYHPRYFIIPKVVRSLYGIFMFLSVVGFIKKLRKKFDFDMIDAHFVYPDGFAALLLGRLFNKKVVVNARGTDINVYAKRRIIKRLVQYVVRNAAGVIAVSEDLKEKIISLGVSKERVDVNPNGVEIDKFFYIEKKEARRTLRLPQDDKMLLSVGNLLEAKGFGLLIEALSTIKEGDAKLFIIGEGPHRSHIEKLIKQFNLKGRVKLVGEVSHKELASWYSAADAFCLTSLREGRPNVVLEALACGTPVVTMNKWGLSNIMTQEMGILLDSYKSDAITSAIERILKKKLDRKGISLRMKDFSWDRTAATVADLFERARKKEDILFFSSDDWDSGLKTSKYHLAINLAKNNRVIFIESIGLRVPKLGSRDFKKAFHKLNKWRKGLRKASDNLFIYTPLLIPLHDNLLVKWFNAIFLRLQILIIKKSMEIRNPVYWTFLPNTLDIMKPHSKRLIYYSVDNMAVFNGVNRDKISAMDDELTRIAKVVFAVSTPLYEHKRSLNKSTHYMPHGVNYKHFAINGADKPEAFSNISGPIVGFYGLISEDWVDFALLKRMADTHPEWSIVMIGKIDADMNNLPSNANIHYLNTVDYSILPSYAKYFDVAIIPFNKNELTQHCNPLKVYEYCAMGKPIVSVDIPELQRLNGMVRIANNQDEFINGIEEYLKSDSEGDKLRRINFAKDNSWERKTEEVWGIVERYL